MNISTILSTNGGPGGGRKGHKSSPYTKAWQASLGVQAGTVSHSDAAKAHEDAVEHYTALKAKGKKADFYQEKIDEHSKQAKVHQSE